MSWTKPHSGAPPSPKDQAKAMADLAMTKQSKALRDYGEQMQNDPTTREAQHALEHWFIAMRALHEAHIEVFRAMRDQAVT